MKDPIPILQKEKHDIIFMDDGARYAGHGCGNYPGAQVLSRTSAMLAGRLASRRST
jgi:hypothetical protein